MKRLIITTALLFAAPALSATAQHAGIDTTTTAGTNADITATPPNLETGGRLLMEEGVERPENVLELKKAKRDSLLLKAKTEEKEDEAEDGVEGEDNDVSDDVTIETDAEIDTGLN